MTTDALSQQAILQGDTGTQGLTMECIVDVEGSDLLHFSELFEHTGGVVQWSPDGLYMAAARKNRLVIRDVHSMEILQLYTCMDGMACIVVYGQGSVPVPIFM